MAETIPSVGRSTDSLWRLHQQQRPAVEVAVESQVFAPWRLLRAKNRPQESRLAGFACLDARSDDEAAVLLQ